MRVLGQQILAVRDEVKTKAGKFHLPDKAQDLPETATAKRVGPQVTEIKPGQKFLFAKYAYRDVPFENKDYILVHEADVLALIKE